MNLSRSFTYRELTRSTTAEQCGIANAPTPTEIRALTALCENVLQPLRDHLGVPLVVTSGFRCVELNRRIGGVANSQHCKGEAADIVCRAKPLIDVFHEAIRIALPFDQIIYEDADGRNWIHVSHSPTGHNRRETLTYDGDGYSVYRPPSRSTSFA